MNVTRPRIVQVHRQAPNAATCGDTAIAQLDPGLLQLFDRLLPVDWAQAMRHAIPTGIATSAALAILMPTQVDGLYWAGRDASYDWLEAPGEHDIVFGEARLTTLNAHTAEFAITGVTETQRKLFTGTLRLLAMREGRPAGFATTAHYQQLRAKLQGNRRVATSGQLAVISAPASIPLGETGIIELEINAPYSVAVDLILPFGHGLSADYVTAIAPGTPDAPGRALFVIRADRPDEVNLRQPWQVELRAGNAAVTLPIAVPDPNPGRAYYLLSEDCETFDGGPLTGDYKTLGECGNQNNFMDPEDYRVQMIQKPARMNEIAEKYGARWTHFFCATQRFAADWAARQSSTGVWPQIAAELDDSIRRHSARHEYAPHVHFDYEPDSPVEPQPRLVYDQATDGILPNQYYDPVSNPGHHFHDWDGSARGIRYLKALGDFTEGSTKSGSLHKSTQFLSALQVNRRAVLSGRTGSHDFGKLPEDQAISTQAYEANGLMLNSDSYRHAMDPVPGGQMFFCQAEDRQKPVESLRDARLLQIGITWDSMFTDVNEMNTWFAKHWESLQGPGVHALLFTTHAMFLRGTPDPFRSLSGGAFEVLEQHLAWVKQHYPTVCFGTASEVALEYLDYYTPELRAHVEPLLTGGDPNNGRLQFPVRLLGKGIRPPAALTITAPAAFAPRHIRQMRILQSGVVLAETTAIDPRRPAAVTLTLTDRDAPLTVELDVLPCPALDEILRTGPVFHDPPEPAMPDLFRLNAPADLIRLLMNPIAGGAEPLGRRLHPLGSLLVGYALLAAQRPGATPRTTTIRFAKALNPASSLSAAKVEAAESTAISLFDERSEVVAELEVRFG
ncbi:MAG: hypothetical protein JNK87_29145 [Bryobacterales bacterium]|nr:hypothetical protein [Bryobacterales bacterium]